MISPLIRTRGVRLAFFAFTFLFSVCLGASPYHLVLEARPAAAFPWLAKFGAVDLHIYEGGVRAETLWLNGFSPNGSESITVENRIARLCGDVPIAKIAAILARLGTAGESGIAAPESHTIMAGTVGGLNATRHRLSYGPKAYIDYWTTSAVPANRQFRKIVDELVAAISPATAAAARKIPGTPVYVELNFRRFKKVALVRMKKLSRTNDDQAKALRVGSFYLKAPFADAIWRK